MVILDLQCPNQATCLLMNNFWKDKKVLITGGAGFIGSDLAKILVISGSEVRVIDNFERGTLAALAFLESVPENRVLWSKVDLRDRVACLRHVIGYDIVIHMASQVGGIGRYLAQPISIFSNNARIDSNVFAAVVGNKIPVFFYASSAHVYPKELQQTPDSPAIKESQAFPSNPELSYGWAKLIGEKQLEFISKEFSCPRIAIARYIGIYGPGQDYALNTGSVIPAFCHRAIKCPEIPFTIWGTGEETRSYCFISDAVYATKLMIEKLQHQKFIGPLNIGKQERISIKDIAKNVVQISGKDIDIKYDTTKETQIWGQWCDCSRAKEELGWEAKVPFSYGLKEVYYDIEGRIH